MNDTERQLIFELVKKAQSVIDSIGEEQMSYAVTKETQYKVNAHGIWDLGTTIGIVEQVLKSSETDESHPPLDEGSICYDYYQDYLQRKRGDNT